MLLKLLQDGFGSAMDLNCAEKILYGANWAYNMKLPGEALKLAAGFGGGMGVESSLWRYNRRRYGIEQPVCKP